MLCLVRWFGVLGGGGVVDFCILTAGELFGGMGAVLDGIVFRTDSVLMIKCLELHALSKLFWRE